MGDGVSLNRSSALQLWAIGTIAPILTILWNIFETGLRSDWFILWTAGRLALCGDIPPAQGTEFTYPPHALFFFTPLAPIPYVCILHRLECAHRRLLPVGGAALFAERLSVICSRCSRRAP